MKHDASPAGAPHPRTRLVELLNQPVRFSIVAALAPVETHTFRDLRDALDVSDSALSKQISALEAAGLVKVTKYFVGKRPATRVGLTKAGLASWERHLGALRAIAEGEI